LAEAILNEAKERNIEIPEAKNFKAITGKGVTAEYSRSRILLGTRNLMQENNTSITEEQETKLQGLEAQGKTAMLLSVNRKLAGIIGVADTLKEESAKAVEELKAINKDIIMITGDNERTAKAIAAKAGIDNVIAGVLPKDKAGRIKQLQEQGKIVAMVGDGMNDAPALAQADIGIAIGAGTDIALETGNIVLVKNDLRDVVGAIKLSSYTMRKIKQNLFWAFFYNTAGIPIAAGALYPFTGFLLNPAIAALAMAFSSVSVVTNSLLMKFFKVR